jgi:hypothetical protein
MLLLTGRCFLVLLLVWEYPDRLLAAATPAPQARTASLANARFVPIALRYRDEAKRSIAVYSAGPATVSSEPETHSNRVPDAFSLALRPIVRSLDPVFALKSLRW